jgi:hypothetical protein
MGTKNKANSGPGKAPRTPLSNEADRRRFVLRNYLSLRTRVDQMTDPMDGTLARPCMEGRWRERWEYLESCDREMCGATERAAAASASSPDTTAPAPAFSCNAGLIAAVLECESKLSTICVRFIHISEEIANRPESKNYLFSVFAACEEAWRRAAGETMGPSTETHDTP